MNGNLALQGPMTVRLNTDFYFRHTVLFQKEADTGGIYKKYVHLLSADLVPADVITRKF